MRLQCTTMLLQCYYKAILRHVNLPAEHVLQARIDVLSHEAVTITASIWAASRLA